MRFVKIGWDDLLPREIAKAWCKFNKSLFYLYSITLLRLVLCDAPIATELYTFSDTSQRAYGACIYVRYVDAAGNIHLNLLCSKSKVNPWIIPRLELCSAVLAVRLGKAVVESLLLPSECRYNWCYFNVVLSWVQKF